MKVLFMENRGEEQTFMKRLTDAEQARLWEEVRKDFPGDEMMQEIHYVRLLHRRQTEGLSSRERIRFFGPPRERSRA